MESAWTKRAICIMAANQVLVYSPEGKLLGKVQTEETPSNCTFGDADFGSLYITARTSVYRARLDVKGNSLLTARLLSAESRRYPTRPFLGVGALIFEDGKILLVERGKEPLKGYWSIPGGIVETGEKLEEASAAKLPKRPVWMSSRTRCSKSSSGSCLMPKASPSITTF